MSRRTPPRVEGRSSSRSIAAEERTSSAPPLQEHGSHWERRDLDAMGEEIDPEELRDFLAGDLLETKADPIFKERLREKLWNIVRGRYGSDNPPG